MPPFNVTWGDSKVLGSMFGVICDSRTKRIVIPVNISVQFALATVYCQFYSQLLIICLWSLFYFGEFMWSLEYIILDSYEKNI